MAYINYAIIALYLVLVLNAMGAVLLDNRQPVKTMAWMMVIFMIPILGLILYYFFGQNIRREHIMTKKSIDLLTRQVISHYVRQARYDVPEAYLSLVMMMKRVSYSFPFAGNAAQIYTEGSSFIYDLLRDMARARHHIHLEFFIIADDAVGRLVSDALIDAARRGIIVRFIYDDVGCWSVPRKFFKKLADNGVVLQPFQPVHFRRLSHKVNYRNHRKIVVIDGNVSYIGGMNLALRYLRGERGKQWRDLQLRLQGAAVYGTQQLFLADWHYSSQELINDMKYYPPVPTSQNNGALMQIVMSAPLGNWANIQLAYVHLIQNATKNILIQTPYFMPTETVLEALQTAALRGVKVQIMVPNKPGGFWMTWANESYYGDVLKAGIEIYAYVPGMLHAKMLLVDDNFCSVGSANIDFRSLNDTFEDSAFIYDHQMTLTLKSLFEDARKDCILITLDMWNRRSRRRRVLESFVRIFSPLF